MFFTRLADFHGLKLQSLFLKALNDLTNKATLHTIRLNHDKGSFFCFFLHVALPVYLFVALKLDSFNSVGVILKVAGEADNFAQISQPLLRVFIIVNLVRVCKLILFKFFET